MKAYLLSTATALLLLAGIGGAAAQDVVVIQPEQRTVIHEYVKKQPPLASLDLPGFHIGIGERVPDTVELHTIDVPDVKYRYTVIGGQTVLVDPDTHQIVEIVQ
jgi:hypothetical protein